MFLLDLSEKYRFTSGLRPSELIEHGEQETEWGGYFVIGGHERLIRILQVNNIRKVYHS